MARDYDPLLDHQNIYGASFVNRLTDRERPVLIDGKHRYSRHDLVMRFKTGNIHAARNLQRIMQKFKFKTIREVFQIPHSLLVKEEGFGPTTSFVLVAVGEELGIDIDKWWTSGITLESLKTRLKKADSMAKKETKNAARSAKRKQLHQEGTAILAARGKRANGASHAAIH